MRINLSRALAAILMVMFSLSPVWATCGGGGGGGTGGGGGGGGRREGPAPGVYVVRWNVWEQRTGANEGLVWWWCPASANELKKSSPRASGILTLYPSQCV